MVWLYCYPLLDISGQTVTRCKILCVCPSKGGQAMSGLLDTNADAARSNLCVFNCVVKELVQCDPAVGNGLQ